MATAFFARAAFFTGASFATAALRAGAAFFAGASFAAAALRAGAAFFAADFFAGSGFFTSTTPGTARSTERREGVYDTMTRSISSPILNFSRALRGGGDDMFRIGT